MNQSKLEKILIATVTVVLFVGLMGINYFLKGNEIFSFYGLVLLIYLGLKMTLSFAYKPFTGQVGDYTVAAVIPTYNESPERLLLTLESVLAQTYPIAEIYVVDDGSKDVAGYEAVAQFLGAHQEYRSRVILHRYEENKGKRHAQSYAFERSTADVFLTVDSDSYIYPDALKQLLITFNDPTIYAATGHLNALNQDENLLTRLIDIRYNSAFRLDRAAQTVTGNILVCSGPLSIYRREVIVPNLPHYLNQRFLGVPVTIGDDRCLTNYALKLGRTVYQETARCDTAVPNNVKTFVRQQIRWNKSFYRETLRVFRLGMERPMAILWSTLDIGLLILFTLSILQFVSRRISELMTPGGVEEWLIIRPDEWKWYLIILLSLAVSGLVRNTHYIRKDPILFLIAPFLGLLNLVLLLPIRYYALLTIRRVKWGTRDKGIKRKNRKF